MLIHPNHPLSLDHLIPEGNYIVFLFNQKQIDEWRKEGAAISKLRKIGRAAPVRSFFSENLNQPIVFTDEPDRFAAKFSIETSVTGRDFLKFDGETSSEESLKFCRLDACILERALQRNAIRSRKIALLNVQNERDARWKRMGLPAASQLIMGALEEAGHQVGCFSILSDHPMLGVVDQYDCVAIGVYEDLFLETRRIIDEVSEKWGLPVILGGPMVTIAPETVAAHCPRASVLLKGEVEVSFPDLLAAFPLNDVELTLSGLIKLSSIPGLFAHGNNWWVAGKFNHQPVVSDFSAIRLSSKHFTENDVRSGIEYSTSRGCPRSCMFCSHVHGRTLRKYPLKVISRHLAEVRAAFREQLNWDSFDVTGYSININDDDLLLDPRRTMEIMTICKESGFRIWGIQTSVESLGPDGSRRWFFDQLQKIDVFMESTPLLWIGTDAFISDRLDRLGKKGTPQKIHNICEDIRKYGFRGYHYWIMTDADSDWPEFFKELIAIRNLSESFDESFHILPNAATLIPYPSTDIYRKRITEKKFNRIILKKLLHIDDYPEFDYPLVGHERPGSNFLYALVEPCAQTSEKLLTDSRSFLALIRAKKLDDAIMESLRIMSLEIESAMDSNRKLELGRLKTRILEDWSTH